MAYVIKDRTIYYNEILRFCKDEKRTIKEIYNGTKCSYTEIYLREILKMLSNEGYIKHTKISRMEQFYQTKVDEITLEQVDFILNNSIRHRMQNKGEAREDKFIKDRNKILAFCRPEPKTIKQICEGLTFSESKTRSLLNGFHHSYIEESIVSQKFSGYIKAYQSKTETYDKAIYDPNQSGLKKLITFDGELDQKRQKQWQEFNAKYGREKRTIKNHIGTTSSMIERYV